MAQDKQAVTTADIGRKFEEIFSAAEDTGVRLYAESSKNDDRVELRFSFQSKEHLNTIHSISTRHVISNDSIIEHLDHFIKEYLSKLPEPKPVTKEEEIRARYEKIKDPDVFVPDDEPVIFVASGDKFEHNVTVRSGTEPIKYSISHQASEVSNAVLEERDSPFTKNDEWFLVGTAPEVDEWTTLGYIVHAANIYGTSHQWYWVFVEPKEADNDREPPSWD